MLVFHRAPKIHYYSQCVLFNFMSQSFNILNILNILSSGSLLTKEKCGATCPAPSVTGWDTSQILSVASPLKTCVACAPCFRPPVSTKMPTPNVLAAQASEEQPDAMLCLYDHIHVKECISNYIYMYLCVLVFLFSKLWFWMSLWGEHLLDSKKLKNIFLYFVWSPPWYLYIFGRCCQSGYLLN